MDKTVLLSFITTTIELSAIGAGVVWATFFARRRGQRRPILWAWGVVAILAVLVEWGPMRLLSSMIDPTSPSDWPLRVLGGTIGLFALASASAGLAMRRALKSPQSEFSIGLAIRCALASNAAVYGLFVLGAVISWMLWYFTGVEL